MGRWPRSVPGYMKGIIAVIVIAACAAPAVVVTTGPQQTAQPTMDQILHGRQLVIEHGCGDCHGGGPNPAATGRGPFPGLRQWLAGSPEDTLPIGGFLAWPRNITPDLETGIGRFSDRQIFNALRYGLRPSATPDVVITSHVPGQGNHPVQPNYLSPGMPWMEFRRMGDEQLWAVIAYLRHAVRPFSHRVPDSHAPPDFWASELRPERIGPPTAPPFPTANEELRAPDRREQILRGRQLVITHGCGGCHGGGANPEIPGWMAGLQGAPSVLEPFKIEFPIGPFLTRPRNITPDNTTGIGRFSERQIFNALRFGLRPGETPDVEITSTVPGQGNHPVSPRYLAPPMPWPAWRHMSDDDLWAIAAYLKNGVRPVANRVEDSDGPPDFWASTYTDENFGPYPAPAFPTANERRP
jgi:mono/diheme cytochrome c family protein